VLDGAAVTGGTDAVTIGGGVMALGAAGTSRGPGTSGSGGGLGSGGTNTTSTGAVGTGNGVGSRKRRVSSSATRPCMIPLSVEPRPKVRGSNVCVFTRSVEPLKNIAAAGYGRAIPPRVILHWHARAPAWN
jgi:hypothetical protein